MESAGEPEDISSELLMVAPSAQWLYRAAASQLADCCQYGVAASICPSQLAEKWQTTGTLVPIARKSGVLASPGVSMSTFAGAGRLPGIGSGGTPCA